MNLKSLIKYGVNFVNNPHRRKAEERTRLERRKLPPRTEVINFLLSRFNRETVYLEIGVRNPNHNFNHIRASKKYSVDPGLEYKQNPVDFKMTSDSFFQKLQANEVLTRDTRFDVIFIDGLHLADQVDRDIEHSLQVVRDDGFIVLHDCNPPTEWHAREEYQYALTPALGYWNGTTWKAFMKWRSAASIKSCCVDTDWGVGILSKSHPLGEPIAPANPFFEFHAFDKDRRRHLNLVTFDHLKTVLAAAP